MKAKARLTIGGREFDNGRVSIFELNSAIIEEAKDSIHSHGLTIKYKTC